MSQKKVQIKKTLGQQTEDQLMKYILDIRLQLVRKFQMNLSLLGYLM